MNKYRFLTITISLLAIATLLLGLSGRAAAAGGAGGGSVDPFYGSFSTEIPIAVPQFHGLEPNLKLVYNSGGTNGWLGVGWGLSGLSNIERASPDGGAPRYNSSDVFYLDGMELIPDTSMGGTHSRQFQKLNHPKIW